jgi:hypothetical protein
MGANTFFQTASGKTAKKAFNSACREAAYDYGHAGYTGTIAEKESFVMISSKIFDSLADAEKLADKLIDEGDERIDDKWGPAGCLNFKSTDGEVKYLFFGWASS